MHFVHSLILFYLAWCYAIIFPESRRKIGGTVKSHFFSNIRNGSVRIFQQYFSGFFQPELFHVIRERLSGVLIKQLTKIRHTDSEMFRHQFNRKTAFLTMLFYVNNCLIHQAGCRRLLPGFKLCLYLQKQLAQPRLNILLPDKYLILRRQRIT